MNPGTIDIEKQQKMLLRGIADIQMHLKRAFQSGLKQDFKTAEDSNRDFKNYVRDHVTAPEIVAYIAEIPSIPVGATEPGLFRIMFMPFVSLISGQSLRARGKTLSKAHEVKGKYGNLEVLVKMMGED
jgi:hypothetical protein